MTPVSPPTTTPRNNSNRRRFTRSSSNITIDRCYFLLIHLIFYIIIFIIIYVRLGQFSDTQEKILNTFYSNSNLIVHQESASRLVNHDHNNNVDCSCQTFPYPKRNRTTRCLEVYFGLTDSISNVFCPISRNDLEHNQWLMIQDRQSNHVDFNRTWNEYRRGFGNIHNQTNFWIGNENLYWLTNSYQCRLKIELTDWRNETRLAIYEIFRISNQNDNYRIQIDGYHGNIEGSNKIDSFSHWHHNALFSTYDHYTTENINCPNLHGGTGWWYHYGIECMHVQLNGILAAHPDGLVPVNTGIIWLGWKGDRHYSFQHVRMSIQPKLKRDRIHYKR